MPLFLISYDLKKYKDYPKLWAEFDRLEAFKPLESVYFLDVSDTAAEVREHFRGFIDDDDLLIVVEFSKRPTFVKAKKGTTAWIDAHC